MSERAAQRVGVMGGTFNPVHLGHLRAAEEARELLALDAFRFVPSAVPPHKPDGRILPFEHRWEMLRIAVEGHPHFQLSDLEYRRPGKSFTAVSLRVLLEQIPPGAELYFLVGLDAFLELHTWWHYREIFELAHIVVLRRPGYPEGSVERFLRENVSHLYRMDAESGYYRHPDLLPVHFLKITHMGISSTQIRILLAQGRSIRYLVPDGVMRYIKANALYLGEQGEFPGSAGGGCTGMGEQTETLSRRKKHSDTTRR